MAMGLLDFSPEELDNLQNLTAFGTAAKYMQALRVVANKIYEAEDIDPIEKRKSIDALYLTMLNVARMTLGRGPMHMQEDIRSDQINQVFNLPTK